MESEWKFTLTQPWTPIELDSITSPSAKKYITAATEGGFVVNAAISRTFEEGETFKSGANAGAKRADKDIEHLWISASARAGNRTVAAFLLHFQNGRMFESKVWDVAGYPIELGADYTIGPQRQARLGLTKQQAEERAAEADALYNTGEMWICHQPRWLTTALDFEEWLGDLCPNFVPKKRPVPRAKKQDNASFEALLEKEYVTYEP